MKEEPYDTGSAGAASRPPVASAGAAVVAPSAADSSKRKAGAPSSHAPAAARQQQEHPQGQPQPQQGSRARGRDHIAGAGALGVQLFRLEPPRVAPLLALVPESVMANLLGFLPGESISNFSTTCRAALPFLHCVPALILTNAPAFPSFARRLQQGEGVRHLASLAFERLEGMEDGLDDGGLEPLAKEQSALLQMVSEVVAAVLANAHKLPNLKTLDLGEVIVTEPQQIKGLHNLASVVSLTYPRFQSLPGPLREGETLASRAAVRRQREIEYHILLEEEVAGLPNLKDLHLGALRWDMLAATGFFPPPSSEDRELGQGAMGADSASASASASARSRARRGVLMWRGQLRSMDCSSTLGMCDEYLRRLIHYYRSHHMHALERLNLSFNAPSQQVEQFTQFSDVRPLAEAFRDGLFARLECLDLSFQVSLTTESLAALTVAWCEQAFPSLTQLRLRDIGIGRRQDAMEEEEEEDWGEAGEEGEGLNEPMIVHAPPPALAQQLQAPAGHPLPPAQPALAAAVAGAAAEQAAALPVLGGQGAEQGGQEEEEEEEGGNPYAAVANLGKAIQRGHLRGLVELDLQDNYLALPGTIFLASGLMTAGALPCLETLDLTMGREEFSDRERASGAMRWSGCAVLCHALEAPGACPRLRRLGLGGHLIGHMGVQALCVLLGPRTDGRGQPCPLLEELDLTSNAIGDEGAQCLAAWLRAGQGAAPRMRRVMLGDNAITGAPFASTHAAAVAMNPCSGLTVLNLERNWLGRAEAKGSLSGLLRAFMGPSIRHLSLARNYDLGGRPCVAAEMGRVLRDFPWLEGLDLRACGRGLHFDVRALLAEWQGQRQQQQQDLQAAPAARTLALTSLDLRRNHLGPASLTALLQAARHMPRLSTLECDGHGTTCSQMLDALLRALQRGELPALLSLTFTCLRVSNREAWRQNEIASNIEHARPWLKAYISWPVPGEEYSSGSETHSSHSSSSFDSDGEGVEHEEGEDGVGAMGADGT